MKRLALLTLALMVASVAAAAPGSDLYPWPTTWSWASVASWAQPLIASGTALPAVASGGVGDLFFDSSALLMYRHTGAAWATATVQDASATNAGKVTTGTQTFAGAKTFNGTVTGESGFIASGGVVGLASSDISLPYEWGVSTWTIHVRGGLVVGIDTP